MVWIATTGALVGSVLIFLATSSPPPEPVAEPMPSTDWRIPTAVSSSTIATATAAPSTTFAAVAPPATTSALPPAQPVTTTTTPPSSAPHPPAATTTTAPRSGGKQLHAVGAGKCLDVPNSTTTPGTQLQIRSCSGVRTRSSPAAPRAN
ncbi:hypothetical protein [Kutzneria kofuensis]|uniref:hypothetical protein n=1 Tax=Kutzneria kofuensis TaxID=103725 RepID=UPI003CD0915E